jgi:hypothetical protein
MVGAETGYFGETGQSQPVFQVGLDIVTDAL